MAAATTVALMRIPAVALAARRAGRALVAGGGLAGVGMLFTRGFAEEAKRVHISFINKHGERIETDAKVGDTLLDVSNEFHVGLVGACEGTCACSTCHVYLDPALAPRVAAMKDNEKEMLDTCMYTRDASRLGCQLRVTEAFRDTVVEAAHKPAAKK